MLGIEFLEALTGTRRSQTLDCLGHVVVGSRRVVCGTALSRWQEGFSAHSKEQSLLVPLRSSIIVASRFPIKGRCGNPGLSVRDLWLVL